MKTLLIFGLMLTGCATQKICRNGNESFRPVYDVGDSCKVRIRQVIVGTDIKIPESIAPGAIDWSYDWKASEFKNGEVDMGHMILRQEPKGSD